MNAIRILGMALAGALALAAQAQDKPCPAADAAKAEKAIERVVGWGSLQQAWRDFRHCDSGANAELYTDAILRMMVEWREVEVLAEAVRQDGDYKAFIHRHLRTPAANDDREAIHSRATLSCPARLEAFCAELAQVVKP